MRLASIIAAAAVTAAIVASPALADIYRFDVNDPGATLGGQPFQNYYFFINGSMAPTSHDADTLTYNVTDYGSTFSANQVVDTVTFYDSVNLGGFSNNFTTTFEQGPQAYQGFTSMPTFQNATYRYDTDQEDGGETLKITDTSATPPGSISAAPEPGTWALMMLGVAGVGAALRFRRRETASLATARATFDS